MKILMNGAAPRALIGAVRADVTTDPKALFEQLNAAVTEMRARHEEAIAAKADDVVLTEQVDRINASITQLEDALNKANAEIAANKLNGAPGDMAPTNPEYLNAFKAHMRRGDVNASMTVGTDADGGYLAPVEWDRTITDKLKLKSPVRENAQVIQISGRGFSRVYNDGLIGSGWVGETAARPETGTPGLTTLTFETGEIYANPAISQTALDDVALNLENWLADEVNGEFAIQENVAFLSGNGVNKPFGILTYVTGAANAAKHPFGAIVATDASGAALTDSDDIIDLIYSLPGERAFGAKFFMNQATLGIARKLKDGDGNYLWQPSYQAGEPATLAGFPVVMTQGMPDVAASAVPVLFGNMEAAYLVIDRVGTRILRDPYTNKPFVHFYTTKRVGGGVQNPEYMRALKMGA